MNDSDGAPIVEASALVKSYRTGDVVVPVLNGVSLLVDRGEFVSVMGQSGSGKSTLLYLLGGLDRPDSGDVRIAGRSLSAMNDEEISAMRRRRLGFIFQFFNLVPNLTVEENVLLPILLDGGSMRANRRRLDEILDTVELAHRRRHRPSELSGGQQQRVAIARALIGEPDLILADEPTGNLDSTTTTEVMELLAHINRDHAKTVIMVTHSLECAAYGSRKITVRDGTIDDTILTAQV
ncbi:MAG: ABC transporter ATP-binding protein [Spirochaetaceae bacterium]|nr:MAG: ABC transporter ATP-binding protein [Spirochaetaceae bacterium]